MEFQIQEIYGSCLKSIKNTIETHTHTHTHTHTNAQPHTLIPTQSRKDSQL